MADSMTFPDTVEEFMEQYKVVDTEQVYTNGTEFVPIYRMKQWFEHLSSVQPYTDEQIQRMQYMEQAQLEKAFELGQKDAKPIVKPERKKGKWILADAYAGKRYRCSECLAFALKTDDGQENLSDYCPVCGARMGEGGQE